MPRTELIAGIPLRFQRVDHESHLGRWTIVNATPIGPLSAWVEQFWCAESDNSYTVEEILPRSATEVLINLGPSHRLLDREGGARTYSTSWVSGLQRRPLLVESQKTVRIAGIRLRPAGVRPLFGMPPSEIAQRVVDLEDVLGPEIERVRQRMGGCAVAEEGLALLADEVARRFARGKPCSEAVLHALSRIEATAGRASISALAERSGWSPRHFADRFEREIGMTPKAFARIVRFEGAIERLKQLRSVRWAEFALERGYYDQAHLALDFREFAGTSPAEVHRRLSPEGLALIDG